MRESLSPVDTIALPWQKANEAVSFKLLNGSKTQGPHTMLLRSAAREPNQPRGQYHPADEELFCLGGDFTFDGSTWFKEGSYAFYPAYFVHGKNVHVRGGYELYLRISDTSKLFWEEEPQSDAADLASGHSTDDYAVQLAATPELEYDTTAIEGVLAKPLHVARDTGEGSTLIAILQTAPKIVLEAPDLIEVFSLSGRFRADEADKMSMHSYMCCANKAAAVTMHCEQAGELLISHGGELRIRAA